MKDWLGQEYGPGDKVLYAALNGRSATMILAEVVSLNESGTVTVQPLGSARWKQHGTRSWYEDDRTGKHIQIWNDDSEHVKTPGYYRDRETGEKIVSIQHGQYHTANGRHVPFQSREYIPRELQPWVKLVTADKPGKVALRVTENITKVGAEFGGQAADD